VKDRIVGVARTPGRGRLPARLGIHATRSFSCGAGRTIAGHAGLVEGCFSSFSTPGNPFRGFCERFFTNFIRFLPESYLQITTNEFKDKN